MNRDDVVRVARSFLGTPFHHQGRIPGRALDCIGLITCIARELGIPHYDDIRYAKRPQPGRLDEGLAASLCVKLDDLDQADHGDILTFWCTGSKLPQHVGVLATDRGRWTMIHTMNRGMRRVFKNRRITGLVIEHTMNDFWKDRIVGLWRYQGVGD